ncbi:hypothetical protein AB0N77_20380 [Streptomyces misionensis]|uniref:hypothetical protein n=1 Tax=Streptomyces misionensis TaxID=67331 RepID=UPI0034202734
MSNNRHNIEDPFSDFPAPCDASAVDLGHVIDRMPALARELTKPAASYELRLAQYRRTAEIGHWITAAATSLMADAGTAHTAQK